MQREVEISVRKVLRRQQNRWKPENLSGVWRTCELKADSKHLRAGPLCMASHLTVLYSDRMPWSKKRRTGLQLASQRFGTHLRILPVLGPCLLFFREWAAVSSHDVLITLDVPHPASHDGSLSHANYANPMIVRLAPPNLGGAARFHACPLTRHPSFVKNA